MANTETSPGSVTLVATGGTAGTITGGTSPGLSQGGSPAGNTIAAIIYNANQIEGLVKMTPCNPSDCRYSPQAWCYSLPVFGSLNGNNQPASYTNDLNSFCISFSGQGTPGYVLQKANDSFFGKRNQPETWINVASIVDNTYGTYQPLGSIPGHPTYMNFTVNWGNVFTRNGNGYYRILFQSCITTPGEGGTQPVTTFLDSPYILNGSQSWYSQVNTVAVNISVQIPPTPNSQRIYYNCPTFYVSPSPTANEISSILAALNGYFTANNLPYTAMSNPNVTPSWYIVGKLNAAQNGQQLFWQYTYYNINTSGQLTQVGEEDGELYLTGGVDGTSATQYCICGLASPQFLLWGWDCIKANGTVKFEVQNTGTKGDINNDGALIDLCALTLYDSIRVQGFFGYGTCSYDELVLEYGQGTTALFGTQEQVRDKGVPAYKFNSKPLPAWVHKQLESVMMLAQTILVSDYNINNDDYFIKQMAVAKKGNYDPKYNEKGKHFDLSLQEFGRRTPVSVTFIKRVQSLISSNCCLSAISG